MDASPGPKRKIYPEEVLKKPEEEDAALSGEKAASQQARGAAAKQPRISRRILYI